MNSPKSIFIRPHFFHQIERHFGVVVFGVSTQATFLSWSHSRSRRRKKKIEEWMTDSGFRYEKIFECSKHRKKKKIGIQATGPPTMLSTHGAWACVTIIIFTIFSFSSACLRSMPNALRRFFLSFSSLLSSSTPFNARGQSRRFDLFFVYSKSEFMVCFYGVHNYFVSLALILIFRYFHIKIKIVSVNGDPNSIWVLSCLVDAPKIKIKTKSLLCDRVLWTVMITFSVFY